MKIETVKGLQKEVKRAAQAVDETEKQIRDLQVKRSTILDEDTLERCEIKIARLNYLLVREKEVLAETECRLGQVKLDFQVYAQKNTF